MSKEKVILENITKAREILSSLGIDPGRAWNNSTPMKGVRQLHVAVRTSIVNVEDIGITAHYHKCFDHWYKDAVWVNVYFYARKYARKETEFKDYQLASDGYYLQKDFDQYYDPEEEIK